MERQEPDEAVLQNLADAGCGPETIRCYCQLENKAQCKQTIRLNQIRLLCQHRTKVLEELHGCQKKLDCLDYLLYRLKKQQKEQEEVERHHD